MLSRAAFGQFPVLGTWTGPVMRTWLIPVRAWWQMADPRGWTVAAMPGSTMPTTTFGFSELRLALPPCSLHLHELPNWHTSQTVQNPLSANSMRSNTSNCDNTHKACRSLHHPPSSADRGAHSASRRTRRSALRPRMFSWRLNWFTMVWS